ncbi:MAG TPA: hypothetical protein VFP98_08105, partial [Candidatus Polarisedimenticolia bacterium]|nr:hypothetical protein [Candidatus Polarisedimenticolia bacterium]
IVAVSVGALFIQTVSASMEEGDPMLAALAALMAGGSIILLLFFSYIVYTLAGAATTVAVSRLNLGRPVTVAESYAPAGRRFWALMGLLILLALIFIGAMVPAFIAALALAFIGTALAAGGGGGTAAIGIIMGMMIAALALVLVLWLMGCVGVSLPALMLEGLGPARAISRSFSLTAGHRFRVILIYILMWILGIVAALIFQGPFLLAGYFLAEGDVPPLWTQVAGTVSGGIGQALTGPLVMIGLVLLYYDVRIRKEAFDLRVMLQALEGPGGQPAATP